MNANYEISSDDIFLQNLLFPESPRWRSGQLWFSDMEDKRVHCVEQSGKIRQSFEFLQFPSGLGWLPDGTLIVSSVQDRKLLAKSGSSDFYVYVDLQKYSRHFINDLIVSRSGNIYVGSMGFNIWSDDTPKRGAITLVDHTADAEVQDEDLQFPNGCVLTDGEKTLIVAESLGNRLTAFDVEDSGRLSNKRLWCSTGDAMPDGICIDSEQGIWIASPVSGACFRYAKNGEMTHAIKTPENTQAYAVALGGDEEETLYVCLSSGLSDSHADRAEVRPGKIARIKLSNI